MRDNHDIASADALILVFAVNFSHISDDLINTGRHLFGAFATGTPARYVRTVMYDYAKITALTHHSKSSISDSLRRFHGASALRIRRNPIL